MIKNKTKMYVMITLIIILAIISQIVYGNQSSFFFAAMLLLGVGFGWYACKAQQDEIKGDKE